MLIAVLLVAACTSQTLTIGEEYRGRNLELERGDKVNLHLQSNPSTGYSWHIERLDTGVLVNESHSYRAPHVEDSGKVGQGGTEIFSFRAVGAGSTKLVMEYRRSWEEETEKRFTLDVTVGR